MNRTERDAIRAKAEKAQSVAPGGWVTKPCIKYPDTLAEIWSVDSIENDSINAELVTTYKDVAEYAVTAMNAIPDLLDAFDALEKENAGLKRVFEAIKAQVNIRPEWFKETWNKQMEALKESLRDPT